MKKISILQAKPNMLLATEVIQKDGSLLLKKGARLNEQSIKRLMFLGIPFIFIETKEPEPEAIIENAFLVPDMITGQLRREAESVVQEMLQEVAANNEVTFSKIKRVVENIISELKGRKKISAKLADIRSLDNYTYAHSVNVCVLAVSTGVILGYSSTKLRELGVSALMHDVGRVFVPSDILDKPGKLSEAEYKAVQRHSEEGYKYIKNNKDICQLAARVALEHHEHDDGTGYPRKLKKQAIHEYSQIVGIADVYDAMTSNRPYKNALKPNEAVELLMSLAGNQLNSELVKNFISHLSVYPEGSIVKLNNGYTGLIIDSGGYYPTRPRVRLLIDDKGNEIKGMEELDLMVTPTIFIDNIIKI